MGRKRRKTWLWLAVERHTKRIVAWVLGSWRLAIGAGHVVPHGRMGRLPGEYCRREPIGLISKATAKPALWRPSIAPYGKSAPCSCLNYVRSVAA
ncbi:hypothetical protein [Hymenobacter sp. 102]|uniref:hypothetical protein n=1 Tax=Hymenobacter sp. 102 TaxID=3403152 RepID=UPI003CF80D95